MLRLIGVALIFSVSLLLLRTLGWRGTPVFCTLAFLFLISEAAGELFTSFSQIKDLISDSAAKDAIAASLKIIGIGYLFGISADICRELGEATVAKGVEIAGRVEIIGVTLPFFEEILKTGAKLLQ